MDPFTLATKISLLFHQIFSQAIFFHSPQSIEKDMENGQVYWKPAIP